MLTTDGDGQFSASDIPAVLSPILRKEAEVVTGSRFSPQSKILNIPLMKRWGNYAVAGIVSSILGQTYRDVSCGFRAYSREALLNLNLSGGFTYTHEVFLNLGVKNIHVGEVPITVRYFPNRQSRIARSLFRYALETSKIIFKSIIYYRPMRLFGFLATVSLLAGLTILTPLAVRYYFTDLISPFKALSLTGIIFIVMSFIFFISGTFLQATSRAQLGIDRALYYARKNDQ